MEVATLINENQNKSRIKLNRRVEKEDDAAAVVFLAGFSSSNIEQ